MLGKRAGNSRRVVLDRNLRVQILPGRIFTVNGYAARDEG